MGALFNAEEIVDITEARIAVGMMHEDVGEICTDTRRLQEGQWFLALGGQEFDGHDFLGEAFSMGAIGCIVEERNKLPDCRDEFSSSGSARHKRRFEKVGEKLAQTAQSANCLWCPLMTRWKLSLIF